MWLARHNLLPVPINSADERISHLHIRSLTPIPRLLLVPYLFGPFVFVNNPLGEGDDLPALRVCDSEVRNVRVAKLPLCALESFVEGGRWSGKRVHETNQRVLGEGSKLDFQDVWEVGLAGLREMMRHFWDGDVRLGQ